MRLTDDQVRLGLNHPDIRVRTYALKYFGWSHHPDATVAAEAIAVVDRLGLDEAFDTLYPLSNLHQTSDTVAWAVERLAELPADETQWELARPLGFLLARTDPALTMSYRSRISSLPGLPRKIARRIERTLEFSTWSADRLWQRLDVLWQLGRNKFHRRDFPFVEAREITSILARDPANAPLLMELLRLKANIKKGTHWRERFLIRLAGEMRYEPAVPTIVYKWRHDPVWLDSQATRALTKIGTDSVVEAVAKAYLRGDYEFRSGAADVFTGIRSDAAVDAAIRLIRKERDPLNREWLIFALVGRPSTKAIDRVRDYIAVDDSAACFQLKSDLIPLCKLMEYEIPELAAWEEEVADPEAWDRALAKENAEFGDDIRLADLDDSSVDGGASDDDVLPEADEFDGGEGTTEPWTEPEKLTRGAPVGRNDPCPCGSGKKYKKCCLRDQGSM